MKPKNKKDHFPSSDFRSKMFLASSTSVKAASGRLSANVKILGLSSGVESPILDCHTVQYPDVARKTPNMPATKRRSIGSDLDDSILRTELAPQTLLGQFDKVTVFPSMLITSTSRFCGHNRPSFGNINVNVLLSSHQ